MARQPCLGHEPGEQQEMERLYNCSIAAGANIISLGALVRAVG